MKVVVLLVGRVVLLMVRVLVMLETLMATMLMNLSVPIGGLLHGLQWGRRARKRDLQQWQLHTNHEARGVHCFICDTCSLTLAADFSLLHWHM